MQNVAIAPCSDRIDRHTLQKLLQSVRMDVSKLKEAHEAAEAAMCVHQATPTQILRLLALLPDKVALVLNPSLGIRHFFRGIMDAL